jgi:hypothetical protein
MVSGTELVVGTERLLLVLWLLVLWLLLGLWLIWLPGSRIRLIRLIRARCLAFQLLTLPRADERFLDATGKISGSRRAVDEVVPALPLVVRRYGRCRHDVARGLSPRGV